MDLETILKANIFGNSIKSHPLYSLVALAAYDVAKKNLPELSKLLIDNLKQKFGGDNIINQLKQNISNERKPLSMITMERSYDPKRATETNWCDAVLHYILSLESVKSLFYNGSVMVPNNKDELKIKDDIFFRLKDLRFKEENLDVISFELVSYTESIVYLREFIKECQRNYNVQLQQDMGDSLYFFDQLVVNQRTSYANQTPQSNLLFEKNKFITNRNLTNVFFEDRETLITRINLFKNNKKWYDDRGIPYTLGLMLYGEPGCGKTSTIKAVAKVLNRHIINVQLSHIRTGTQLKKLFYDEKVHIIERENDVNVKHHTINIPIDKRLYVIEDIDAMTDIIKRRDVENEPTVRPFQQNNQFPGMAPINESVDVNQLLSGIREQENNDSDSDDDMFKKKKKNKDPITLSSLLNILDGTLEIPGRVLIITTNHPEKIDPALIRPGRIDMQIHYKKANRHIICQMFKSFYDKNIPINSVKRLPDYHWTPAQVNAIMFRNFFHPEEALKELLVNNVVEQHHRLASIGIELEENSIISQ